MDAIQYPVTVQPFVPTPDNQDVPVTTVIVVKVDGDAAPVESSFTANGGTFNSSPVPVGSSGQITAKFVDKAGNVGPECTPARFENASDTTPPPAPADAVVIGAGQAVTV